MKAHGITKTAMARRMHTSRSMLDRLLDEADTGLTIDTISRARKRWVPGESRTRSGVRAASGTEVEVSPQIHPGTPS